MPSRATSWSLSLPQASQHSRAPLRGRTSRRLRPGAAAATGGTGTRALTTKMRADGEARTTTLTLTYGDDDDRGPKELPSSPPAQQLVTQGSHAFTDIALDSPTHVSPGKNGVEGSGAATVSTQQADSPLVSAAELTKARKDNAALRRSNAELKRRAASAEKVPWGPNELRLQQRMWDMRGAALLLGDARSPWLLCSQELSSFLPFHSRGWRWRPKRQRSSRRRRGGRQRRRRPSVRPFKAAQRQPRRTPGGEQQRPLALLRPRPCFLCLGPSAFCAPPLHTVTHTHTHSHTHTHTHTR